MDIKIGNQSGRYFNPAITEEVMKPLAELVANTLPLATDYTIFYDEPNDFHHLTFTCDGIKVDVRYYKVIGYSINGTTGKWSGAPLFKKYQWADFLAKELKALRSAA